MDSADNKLIRIVKQRDPHGVDANVRWVKENLRSYDGQGWLALRHGVFLGVAATLEELRKSVPQGNDVFWIKCVSKAKQK